MADLSKHVKLRCADRSIKSKYVDHCMRKGERTNADDAKYKYNYKGLCVIATRGSAVARQKVVTSYWMNNDGDGPQAYEALLVKARSQKTEHVKSGNHNAAKGKRYMSDR